MFESKPALSMLESIFHLYGVVTITGEGLQNLGQCLPFRAFQQRESLLCKTCCDKGPGFFQSHPLTRLLVHTMG
jgi:hypothetical protein